MGSKLIEIFDGFTSSGVVVGGEANTASNLGGGIGVFAQKVLEDLQFKTFIGGTGVTITADSNEITVSIEDHTTNVSNPHAVTKTQVGLGNVPDIDVDALLTTHEADVANPHVVTATQVGLGSVDDTSDVDKPVSTLQQAAIDTKQDDVITTQGDIVIADVSGDPARLPIGTNNYILKSDGTTPSWQAEAASPITTRGDVIRGDSGGSAERLVLGAANEVLTSDGTDVSWELPPVTLNENHIINSHFDIWQRSTSQTASGVFSDDRWANGHNSSAKTHSRQSFADGQQDVPNAGSYYSRTVITSSTTTSGAVIKDQKIEDVRTLENKEITLTFYAKADAAKDITAEFEHYFGTGGSPSAFVNFGATKFNLTTSWQKFTTTLTIPSLSGKTIGTNGDHYLQLSIWMSAGTDFNARTDSLGLQTGTFDISKVSIVESGTNVEPIKKTVAEELLDCLRYYEQQDDFDACPWWSGEIGSGQSYYIFQSYKVTKRVAPTVTNDGENLANFNASIATVSSSVEGFRASGVASASGTGYYRFKWSADAEL